MGPINYSRNDEAFFLCRHKLQTIIRFSISVSLQKFGNQRINLFPCGSLKEPPTLPHKTKEPKQKKVFARRRRCKMFKFLSPKFFLIGFDKTPKFARALLYECQFFSAPKNNYVLCDLNR